MDKPTRKIIGTGWVTVDKVTKDHRTANTVNQRIKRLIVKVIILECGHNLPLTSFTKAPANSTGCKFCGENSGYLFGVDEKFISTAFPSKEPE
jgi:hypothetical protein